MILVALVLHDLCELLLPESIRSILLLASSISIASCSVSLEYDTSTALRLMAMFTKAVASVPGWYSPFAKIGMDTFATTVSLSKTLFGKHVHGTLAAPCGLPRLES